jgi:hypothetical protein
VSNGEELRAGQMVFVVVTPIAAKWLFAIGVFSHLRKLQVSM